MGGLRRMLRGGLQRVRNLQLERRAKLVSMRNLLSNGRYPSTIGRYMKILADI